MKRNPVAQQLRTPKFKSKKVESKKNITEKKKSLVIIMMATTIRQKFYIRIKMTEVEAAYIAGLFDGEGTITYKKYPERKKKGNKVNTYNCWRISMEIAMTDESVLNWLHEALKVGTVTPKKVNGKRVDGTSYLKQWRWRCTFRDAYYVCLLIWPFAHTKLPKINKILDHYYTLQKNNIVDIRDYHRKSFK